MSLGMSGKGQQVQAMFDQLAPSYDRMNRIMTLGQDQTWRKFVVARAQVVGPERILDLASGTGDIAFELKRQNPQATVVAADFSLGMLQQGKKRPGSEHLAWLGCDAMQLPFPDASFDVVTFGYLLRNVSDMAKTLAEVRRVLRPGGRVVCLDTMPPPPSIFKPFIIAYLSWGLPLLGRLIAGNTSAYAYLSSSTLGFQDPASLKLLFEQAGFVGVSWKTFMLQTVAVHWAQTPN